MSCTTTTVRDLPQTPYKESFMLKRLLIAAAIVIASPTFVSAQDIFWSFSPTAVETNLFGNFTGSGSVYIFSDGEFEFDSLDLNFTTSNSNAIRFTGGEAFNPTFNVIGFQRFDSSNLTIDPGGASGNLFLENIGEANHGVNTLFGPLFDPGFDAGVGSNGAVLLARVDLNLNVNGKTGPTDLEFTLGPLATILNPSISLNPSLGSPASFFPNLTPALGDINCDGVVDFFDIAPFISLLATGKSQLEADFNFNDVVDFFDIAPFISVLSGQPF